MRASPASIGVRWSGSLDSMEWLSRLMEKPPRATPERPRSPPEPLRNASGAIADANPGQRFRKTLRSDRFNGEVLPGTLSIGPIVRVAVRLSRSEGGALWKVLVTTSVGGITVERLERPCVEDVRARWNGPRGRRFSGRSGRPRAESLGFHFHFLLMPGRGTLSRSQFRPDRWRALSSERFLQIVRPRPLLEEREPLRRRARALEGELSERS